MKAWGRWCSKTRWVLLLPGNCPSIPARIVIPIKPAMHTKVALGANNRICWWRHIVTITILLSRQERAGRVRVLWRNVGQAIKMRLNWTTYATIIACSLTCLVWTIHQIRRTWTVSRALTCMTWAIAATFQFQPTSSSKSRARCANNMTRIKNCSKRSR